VEEQQSRIKYFFDEEAGVKSLRKTYLKEFDYELERLQKKKGEKQQEMQNLQEQLHTLEANQNLTNQKVIHTIRID
jgi:septal ring factor EnvC (AmiA/AmiB activator)